MKTGAEWLADLIRRVPVHVIDVEAERRAGNSGALEYAMAIQQWQDEAALAIAEAEHLSGPPSTMLLGSDAYARTATASELLRLDPAG